MNLHLVTGYAGAEHVTAADQGAFHALTMGKGQYVLNKGNLFAASILSYNQVKVLDGEIYMQGRYIRLEPDAYVELTVETGEQGKLRHDLIVARYTNDVSTGIEEANLVVIKGTAAESSPADPEHTTGNIFEGTYLNDFPLFRVVVNGLVITSVEPLFTPKDVDLDLKQDATNLLVAEETLDNDDSFPFFDASADAQRKVLWSIIKQAFASTDHLSKGILPVERGGTGFNNLADLGTALGNVRLAVGSYTGTGTSGSANANSLTFDFAPRFLIIFCAGTSSSDTGNGFLFMRPTSTSYAACQAYGGIYNYSSKYLDGAGGSSMYAKLVDKTISWYWNSTAAGHDSYQFNDSGKTYNYIAFG